MTGDSGFLIGDERIGDPRTRTTRTYGGRDAKIIRRRDGRIGIVDAHTGEPLGMLISEADVQRFDDAELAPIDDDDLGPARGIVLTVSLGVLLLIAGYACFVAGRWFERQYGADIHTSRFSVR